MYRVPILRIPEMIIAIIKVRILQKRYKHLSLNCEGRHSNQVLAKLRFWQHKLYYWKSQFEAWGYFHPSCVWSPADEKFYRWLFPTKDFKEVDLVIWHNPEAVTYYHNKIYRLQKGVGTMYHKEIETQLREWNDWN